MAKEPSINQILLQPSNEQRKPFSLNSARPEVADVIAEQRRQQELLLQQFTKKQQLIQEQQRALEEQKAALLYQQQEQMYMEQQRKIQEIQNQQQQQYQQQVILYQINQIKAQAQHQASLTGSSVASPEQQATIQKLLLELAKINPQLALQTLKQFKQETAEESQPAPKPQQAFRQPQAPNKPTVETKNLSLVHNMGSILQTEPAEFTAIPPSAVKPSARPIPK